MSSFEPRISIITKFVLWSVVLLGLTIYVVARSTWNNQDQPTHDYIYWQDHYKTVAASLTSDPEVRKATLATPETVNQVTVLQFPFMQADGANQQRVDRCQSCHVGLENPSMTAENIVRALTKGKENLSPDQLAAFLRKPENREIYTAVKVLSAHPGKTGGLVKSTLPYALAAGSSPDIASAASLAALTRTMASHSFATYGCTTCHYGSGRELQERKAHATTNEAWLQPLMPAKYMDAACAQCHTSNNPKTGTSAYLEQMRTIARGQSLFKSNACWGCHKVDGFSKGNVGPELTNEGRIVRSETIEHQLWDPRYKVNNCVMPYFFSRKIITDFDAQGKPHDYYLNDYGDKRPLSELAVAQIANPDIRESLTAHGYVPDARAVNDVDALTTYLLAQTGSSYSESQGQRIARIAAYNAQMPLEVPKTIDEGRLIFEQSGCYSCHYVGDAKNPRNGKGGGVGPNLSWEGSRHSYQWIEEHYRNPQEFVPKSIMPIFPFSDSQRAALTLFDASRLAPGSRPVSADQDMAPERYPAGKAVTNKTPNPQLRYMTR
ncbi:MAG: c-type cytochrome [Capsulimonadaceae bacterium]|nr:c-type cytochrome [Capsulimonadaceae bacterium]